MAGMPSIAELQAVAPGGGGLQKLRISYNKHGRQDGGRIEAMFNPTEIGWSRSVNWKPEPVISQLGGWGRFNSEQQFLSAEPATMSVDLLFDTYESRTPAAGLMRAMSAAHAAPFAIGQATDVRALTDEVALLAEVDRELHHPPVCRLSWGTFGNVFTGVVSQLDQNFTMFLPDGTPVRATVSCTFTEYATRTHALRGELHSADVHKTRVLRRSDTLQSLAADEYGDPALWRHIARANGIVNPRRDLRPGMVLKLPKLER